VRPEDPREAQLLWLRAELSKRGIRSYIVPADQRFGPTLHCDPSVGSATVNMCGRNYLFLGPLRDWVEISANRPGYCADEIIRVLSPLASVDPVVRLSEG
jgi:hypothetical protein